MYAVITLDNEGQPTLHARARTYTVALAQADELLADHTTVTIAYMHSSHYERLVTLTHERNTAPIRHDYIVFNGKWSTAN
jgi:hypothetical protein